MVCGPRSVFGSRLGTRTTGRVDADILARFADVVPPNGARAGSHDIEAARREPMPVYVLRHSSVMPVERGPLSPRRRGAQRVVMQGDRSAQSCVKRRWRVAWSCADPLGRLSHADQ
jgi:hypothetical protein